MHPFIDIQYETKYLKKIVSKTIIKKWILHILNKLNQEQASCAVYFVSNESIQKLNLQYLNHDYPTDVLSFSQMEGEKVDFINLNFLGDIVISIPYALAEAEKSQKSILEEILFLVLHGLLHLLGYDHENDSDNRMISLQDQLYNSTIGEFC